MQPIGWFFLGIVTWSIVIVLILWGNKRWRDWQNEKMRDLHRPTFGGRVDSEK